MTFLWTDVLTFPAIFQGVLIAFVLITIKKTNKTANYFLAFVLLCCTFSLIGKVAYSRISPSSLPIWGLLPDTLMFLFCPLIYLFVRKLLFSEQKTNWILYFIPAFIYLTIVFYFFTFGNIHFNNLVQSGQIWTFFYFAEGVGLLTNLTFLYKSNQLRRKYLKQENDIFSFNQDLIYFLGIFLLLVFLCMICWLVSFLALGILQKQLPYINYSTMWFVVPFLTYFVGYYMLAKPTFFRIDLATHLNTEQNYTYSKQEYSSQKIGDSEKLLQKNSRKVKIKNRLTTPEIEILKQKLEVEFNQNNVFLEENLTLYRLAEKLESSANDLSWLLNTIYKQSFYDFVNEYRIKEFLSKVNNQEHKQKTILALALESGFNSKATFNKVFKAKMKNTPSAYIKTTTLEKVI